MAVATKKKKLQASRPTGMTFATLDGRSGYRLGVRTSAGIVDAAAAGEIFRIRAPRTIEEVIAGADCAPLRRLVEKTLGDARGRKAIVPEERAKFGPAVPNPPKIICVGLNYRGHAAETGSRIPEVPMLFSKFGNALTGHRSRVRLPVEADREFDYEVELVVVIGRRAFDVPEARALRHVFGYATGNDLSARALQRVSSQLLLGKTPDGFAPMGPYVVSADQIPDPQTLRVTTHVNGELRQDSNTGDMIFTCAQIVSYCSRHFTLTPGDIIYTGTPQGVILGYPPERRVWLKPGDRVVTEVERLGALEILLA
jgi:2-keto-4-pentenoate hydratase/2-oxohepta-3-ene-1,7-dioic acid hydratase in catechol pathway